MAQSLPRPFPRVAERNIAPPPLFYLDRDIGRFARDLLAGGWMSGLNDSSELVRPAMNVSETDSELRISLDLPGVDESSIDVMVEGDILTIRATRSDERRDDGENFHIVERHFGTYQRNLQLPFHVDAQTIHARLENGVLKLVIPKSQGVNRAQKVSIQSASANGGASTQDQSSTGNGQSSNGTNGQSSNGTTSAPSG